VTIRTLAVLTLLGGCMLCACKQAEKPDIILITLDTTRADRLGIYGNSPSPSPNLDRLAQRSVVYERAYATSSWTLPSHASIFTGLLPSRHGAGRPDPNLLPEVAWRFAPLAEEFVTLAELLHASGYRTAAVIGGAAMSADLGVAQGFEHYDATFEAFADKWNGKRAAYVADRAIELIRSFADQPYFLFLNFFDPHRPYDPPDGRQRGLPEVSAEAERAILEKLGSPPVPLGQLEPALLAAVQAMLVRYDAEIAYMDAQLERVLAAVGELPRDAQPIIAITSDHGESFGEHYFFVHGVHLYEDNVRVPLLIHDPREGDAGARVERAVQNHQLFATLLDAAGVEPPTTSDPARLDQPGAPVLTELWRTELAIGLVGTAADR
jgi:arylsulfatase A-like enzyme